MREGEILKRSGVSRNDVLIGLGVALVLGLVALALVVLLVRPQVAPPPTPVQPLATPTVLAAATAEFTSTPASTVPATVTATLELEIAAPTPGVITYTVQPDDTLWDISVRFEVSVEALSLASRVVGDVIWPGQVLTIPVGGAIVLAPTQELQPTQISQVPTQALDAETWVPSVIDGDLNAAYPEIVASERFALHLTPGTYPAQNAAATAAMVGRGLAHIEATFSRSLPDSFDVYVAGSIFAGPNQALRGFSVSASRRYFFLHDGTGNQADQQYIATHELTHLFTWNVFGRPVSAMLSEGAAVSAGMSAVAGEGHLPLQVFCAAYDLAGKLPRISGSLSYQGHIRDLENYYAAGCFVQYLLDTYGAEKFGDLYATGDYGGVYGMSLAALEEDWRTDVARYYDAVDFEPEILVAAVDDVAAAYETLFGGFRGTPEQMRAYRVLDAGRIALIEGRFADVNAALSEFRSIPGL